MFYEIGFWYIFIGLVVATWFTITVDEEDEINLMNLWQIVALWWIVIFVAICAWYSDNYRK